MEQVIRFQGHDFNMIEEGLYKTEDDFVMDDDFLEGDYGELVIAAEVIDDAWHPRYVSRFEYGEKLRGIAYAKNFGIARRPDLNSDAVELGILTVEENTNEVHI